MAQGLSLEAAAEMFNTEVVTKFQNDEELAGSTSELHGLIGTTTNIPVSGQLEMASGSFEADNIPVTPYAETNVALTVKQYRLKTSISMSASRLFAFNVIQEQANAHRKAIGRQLDWMRLNAIFDMSVTGSISTRATFTEVPVDLEGSGLGLSIAKISNATDILTDQGATKERYLWLTALARSSLKQDPRFVSWDYNMNRPLMGNAPLNYYLDIGMMAVGSNGKNKLPANLTVGPPAYATYKFPMLSKDAVVVGFTEEITTKIVAVEQDHRWELISVGTMGAVVVQEDGIVLINAQVPGSPTPSA